MFSQPQFWALGKLSTVRYSFNKCHVPGIAVGQGEATSNKTEPSLGG